MKTNNILLVGAGGTGSMILPAIHTHNVTIADGDTYEEANKTRQPHAVSGENKAELMCKVFNKFKTVSAHPHMLNGTETFKKLDIIISAVDNNEGRAAAYAISNKLGIPLIIAQNQEWNPSAWLYLPMLKGTSKDPFLTYSLDAIQGQSTHVCEGLTPKKSERGQSGLANLAAAGHAVTILHSLGQKKWENYIGECNSLPWPKYKKLKDL